ncbi:hypothetical protein [Actinoplanes sp. G11-F43]|uniref:hypothetical protein n=1 Tax=Actinoplanes sp. G11-F43 TaxID=3424130 RepID=UPI003D3321D6
MTSPLLIELRRGPGKALALTVAVVGALALATHSGPWLLYWNVFTFAGSSAMFLLVPIALGGGAMLGRRDGHTRAAELMGSTGRPLWQRMLPGATALAAAVIGGHLLLLGTGAAVIAANGGALAARGVLSVLVDTVLLAGAAWTGIAAGRAWPSRILPPALATLALVVQLAAEIEVTAGEPNPMRSLNLNGQPPGAHWEVLTDQALMGRLSLALGLLLAGAVFWLSRVGGVALLVAGIAATVAITPDTQPDRYRIDLAAQRLVCADGTPEVCVTAVHAHLLPSVTPQVRAALERLGRLPDAPTRAVEWRAEKVATGDDLDHTGATPRIEPGTVAFRLDVDTRDTDPDLEASILAGAGTTANGCEPRDLDALWAAGAWLSGRDTLEVTDYVFGMLPADDSYRKILAELRKATPEQQVRRVTALRDAANRCEQRDLTAILTGQRAS